ncbi:Asp-tRNA(Asn)/Glu-tRNA(Gln) amidotransferase subunit GatB [Youxingia wuxianensis]|uniref:Aspartyl/glutamyl-tRNA(Asn/Gln) amidotransferase subunit B n=1 Tax=Youxingia wuxianensis TaxID=2763678 RepID=A0A926ENZ8_9FIRM|nr:Asp-tRNA(Asn)/Glu-tRNA(Gln) amidotransferase subunit GatB [Youxingia wuxianensis]MBC8584747.1 Asp-tRNA(Asn)/Glu-tRNA(Gln) amidotransferase subunit GatB [Youxingia wuxianensis]
MKYEMVAGLETHVELSTKTKIFCGCTTQFGSEPNTHCCPICIGLPGTLPKLNKTAVDYAILAGLATNCKINSISKMDRKNYVYPDLSKAYQVSQYDKPLCYGGYITLSNGRTIRITRIHIEEDAGKLVHERGDTYVDYNRAGVPLIEIVTEPDIRSVDEVREYVEKLQLIMKYIGISDCKMQEGSLRCDVNISVRPQGSETLGTRTEIKNMNSFTFMEKAIRYEFERQVDLVENGEKIIQETRRFDESQGITESMRSKEDAHDYRYFREPDLVTIITSQQEVSRLEGLLPELPDAKLSRYIEVYALSPKDAVLLTKYRRVAQFFDRAVDGIANPKFAVNLILGQIFSRLPSDSDKENFDIKVSPENFHELLMLLDSGKIRMNLAKTVLDSMLDTGGKAEELISEEDLAGLEESALQEVCQKIIDENPAAVSDYLSGKEKAVKSLVGGVMKATKGRADAAAAQEVLIKLMKN